MHIAPLWLIIIPQIVSVFGDSFAQRTVRKYITHRSRRRFVMGLVFVSSLQMLLFLTIIQLGFPKFVTVQYQQRKDFEDYTTLTYISYEPTKKLYTYNETLVRNRTGELVSYDWCNTNLSEPKEYAYTHIIYSTKPINQTALDLVVNPFELDTVGDDDHDSFFTVRNGMYLYAPDKSFYNHEQQLHCVPQGPLAIPRLAYYCPLLLLNGIQSVIYYFAEASLYKHAMGVVLIVLASLSAAFFLSPLEKLVDLQGSKQLHVVPVFLGIIGAFLSFVERNPTRKVLFKIRNEQEKQTAIKDAELNNQEKENVIDVYGFAPEGETGKTNNTDENRYCETCSIYADAQTFEDMDKAGMDFWPPRLLMLTYWQFIGRKLFHFIPLLLPLLALVFVAMLWWVSMKWYSANGYTNAWGYNSFDQVLLPFYVFPVQWIFDIVPFFKHFFEQDGFDQTETFVQAFKGMLNDLFVRNHAMGFIHMFTYRFLVNARAISYTYIAILYSLNSSVVELKLIRIIFSWSASLVLSLFWPAFIGTSKVEQAKVKDIFNLCIKLIGTLCILGALWLMNSVYKS